MNILAHLSLCICVKLYEKIIEVIKLKLKSQGINILNSDRYCQIGLLITQNKLDHAVVINNLMSSPSEIAKVHSLLMLHVHHGFGGLCSVLLCC